MRKLISRFVGATLLIRNVRAAAFVAAATLIPVSAYAQGSGPCVITSEPPDVTVCADIGGANSFTLSASIDAECTWALYWLPASGGGPFMVDSSNVSTYTAHSVIAATQTSETGYYYFVFTRAVLPRCTTYSRNVHIVITPAGPRSFQSPQSHSVCLGEPETLTATASGTASGATWYWTKNGAVMNNTARITGTSGTGLTATLNFANIVQNDQANYVCHWGSTSCGETSTSTSASLTVTNAVTIDTQPVSVNSCVGGPCTMYVVATGSPTYQWERKDTTGSGWSSLVGETDFVLSMAPVQESDARKYRCRLTSAACGTIYTDEVTLTVGAPTISNQPDDTMVCGGSTLTLSLVAQNRAPDVTYSWVHIVGSQGIYLTDGGRISGSNTRTLTITQTVAGDAGLYYCFIDNPQSNGCDNSVTSDFATVTVGTGIPVITTQPRSAIVCSSDLSPGQGLGFSVIATGASAYQWQELQADGSFVNMTESGADTYTVGLPATGQYYRTIRCVVSNDCGSVTSNAVVGSKSNNSPVVSLNPVNVDVCSGSTSPFTLTAGGTGVNMTYAWRKTPGGLISDGNNYQGTRTATLTILQSNTNTAGSYVCEISNGCGTVSTLPATVTLISAAPTVVDPPDATSVCLGEDTSLSVIATGSGLSYQWKKGNNSLIDGPHYQGTNTPTLVINGAIETDESNFKCTISNACGDVTSPTAAVTVNEARPVINTQPAAQATCPGSVASFTVAATGTNLTYQWQKANVNIVDGGQFAGATTPTLTISGVTSGDAANYRCLVTNTCATVMSNVAALTVTNPVTIVTPPIAQVSCNGNSVTFRVVASGSPTLTYRWQRARPSEGFLNLSDGVEVSGALTDTLTLLNVSASDVANYRCRVTNACGNTFSDAARLDVDTTLAVTTQPAAHSVCLGSDTTFSVVVSGPNLTYRWQKNGVNLSDGGRISGATTAVLSIIGAVSEDAANYRCVIANACGSVNSNAAALTVIAPATISAQPLNQSTCPAGSMQFTVAASGTGPFTYQWQWQPAPGGSWVNISSGVNTDPVGGSIQFVAQSPDAATLTISDIGGTGTFASHWEKRCVVTTSCGNVNSDSATATICAADFNCDGTIDFFDYLDFVDAFSSNTPTADFNADGSIDFFDYLDFVDAFSIGC